MASRVARVTPISASMRRTWAKVCSTACARCCISDMPSSFRLPWLYARALPRAAQMLARAGGQRESILMREARIRVGIGIVIVAGAAAAAPAARAAEGDWYVNASGGGRYLEDAHNRGNGNPLDFSSSAKTGHAYRVA